MALQDLTPQLRTRLSRMERAVGWFVFLAVALLAFGFVYYVYNTAARKGWFLTKAPYFTFVDSAEGLRVGDPVKLMGFDAGAITEITPMPGDDFLFNVYVQFELKSPNYGYMWTEGSYARVTTADFLGKRVLEVTKGTNGYPTYLFHPVRIVPATELPNLATPDKWELGQELIDDTGTNFLARARAPLPSALAAIRTAGLQTVTLIDVREKPRKSMTGMWNYRAGRYDPYTNKVSKFWLVSEESPAVTERLEHVMNLVQGALPGVFALTNQLREVLSNTASLTSNLNVVAVGAQPLVSNLAAATAQLDRPGALGEWLLPTNINRQLDATLGQAHATLGQANTALASANTNLAALVENLNRSLDNLAGMTSNLNEQVHANTNILTEISETIIHADEFIQGLKHHWLLRSAFKSKEKPSAQPAPAPPLRSPKDRTP